MKRKIIILFTFFSVLYTSALADITLNKSRINAGKVKSNDIVFAEIEVKNSGLSTVNLSLSAKYNLCDALSLPKNIQVKSNSIYDLVIQFSPESCKSGIYENSIIIDGENINRTINISAEIVGDVYLGNLGNVNNNFQKDKSEKIYIAYFYKPGCLKCAKVERWLQSLKDNKVLIKKFNIKEPENLFLAEALAEKANIPNKYRLSVPAIYTGNYFLIGSYITKSSLRKILKLYNESMSVPPWDTVKEKKTEYSSKILKQFQSFSAVSIFAAGLIDGVNPCAFAILVFLLSYLQIAKYNRKQLVLFGLLYTLCVFLSYLVIGFGLFHGVSILLVKFPQITLYFYLFTGILALFFGILSVVDIYIYYKKGAKGMLLKLSDNVKGKTRFVIRNNTGKIFLVSGIIFTAVSVSLLELGCTGQIYLPIITFIIQSTNNNLKAILFLILYNLAFIIPLLVIFLFFIFGVKQQKVGKFFEKKIVVIKILMGFVFFALGIIILLGI